MIYKDDVTLDAQDIDNIWVLYHLAMRGGYMRRHAWAWFLDRVMLSKKEADEINAGNYLIVPEENIYR